jgi:Flp pilus assembly protein TadD
MPSARRSPARPGLSWAGVAGVALCAALLSASGHAADEQARIRALLASGQGAEALGLAESALAANPRDTAVLFLRGVALMDLQRDAEALAHFEGMSQEYPGLPDPWNNIALLQVRAGRFDQARVALEYALRSDPGHRTARANLGLVYLMLAGQTWEALAASGPLDPRTARRLEAVRALLADGGR